MRSQLTPTRSYSPTKARPRSVYFDAFKSGPIVHRLIGNFVAVDDEQGRQITVHAGEIREPEIVIALIDLEPAARIRATIIKHLVANPIGEARSSFARALCLAPFAQAADESWLTAVGPEPRHEPYDVRRVVLPSPSMVAMTSAVAAITPLRNAALWPARLPWRR